MSKRLFLRNFFKNNKEIGSIIPSSTILATKIVNKKEIEKAKVIIELGAGTGAFTKYIFKYSQNTLKDKKIFIIEKDKDFFNLLIKIFPQYKEYIYNIDVLNLDILLKKYHIQKIDLIISGLPLKSLPEKVYNFIINKIIVNYFYEDSIFIQFSYFRNFGKKIEIFFKEVKISKCFFNFPIAYIFNCKGFKNEK